MHDLLHVLEAKSSEVLIDILRVIETIPTGSFRYLIPLPNQTHLYVISGETSWDYKSSGLVVSVSVEPFKEHTIYQSAYIFGGTKFDNKFYLHIAS